MAARHTIAFVQPGHFHAALTLKTPNARVDPNVHLYAAPGPDREAFVGLIEAFNTRADNPTAWRLNVHDAHDPVASLIADGHAQIAILAGNNARKLEWIAALHRAGINVLADKPWLTSPDALTHLEQITSGAPLAVDIMTERFDVRARLRRAVVATPEVFGEFAVDDPQGPAIEVGSRHHLYKVVNGEPLVRPAWYYDVDVQGDGLVDIQSHMTDQMQWLIGETPHSAEPFELDRDVAGLEAQRWGTPVPAELFADSTGVRTFPPELEDRVTNGVLDFQCNSEIRYRLRGVPVAQRAEWGQREPPNSGDIHSARIRGTRAELWLEHGEHTDYRMELHMRPRAGVRLDDTLPSALGHWQGEFPGLGLESTGQGYRFVIPDALATTHEQHFAMVLGAFLDQVESGDWPTAQAARIRMRYSLLAAAKQQVDGHG